MTATDTYLQYTPPASVDTQVRVYQHAVQLVEVDNTLDNEIDLNNASITAGYGFYQGTAKDVRRSFSLTHKGQPIFQRNLMEVILQLSIPPTTLLKFRIIST